MSASPTRKILYVSNVRMPTEKAHGLQIAKMCEAFAAAGADIELIVPKRRNAITADARVFYGIRNDLTIRYLPTIDLIGSVRWLGYWLQLASFAFSVCTHVLFISRKDHLMYTREFITAILLRIIGFETVYEAHRVLLKKRMFFFLLKPLDKIVTNSRGVADEFIAHGFDQVLALPNGIDLKEFSFNADKLSLRKELGLPENPKIALYSGFLYGWKGIDTLVDAAEILAKKRQTENIGAAGKDQADIRFIIVGGSEEDILAYRKIISDREIPDIDFIGYRDRKTIPRYLKAADALLLPNSARSEESVRYTSPIKLFEYMASGVPIIASDLPSIREILNESNAVLVPPDDARALARGLCDILGDYSSASAISRKARADVEPLTWDNRAKKILEFVGISH